MTSPAKYDTETTWTEPCAACGTNVEQSSGRLETIGPYCDGCFGWCDCPRHTGACKPPEPK